MNGVGGGEYIYTHTHICTAFTKIVLILSYEASLTTFQNVKIPRLLSGHNVIKLLLLLSHFSRVRLCATP